MFYKEKAYTRINWKNRPNLSTPLGAKNLNKMDEAIEELDERVVETSIEAEKNRLSVQTLGLEIESVSKDIEEVRESTQYIDSSKIVTNKSGAPVYIDDASNMNNEGIDFLGESKQNGTPTPTSPIPIESKIVNRVDVLGKNLLNPSRFTTKTSNSVTFTPVFKDGLLQYINVNTDGPATADSYYAIIDKTNVPKEALVLNGCEGGSASTYSLLIAYRNEDDSYEDQAFQSQTDVDLPIDVSKKKYSVTIFVKSGATVNNARIYPMLRPSFFTDGTYEPYQSQTVNLSAPIELNGFGGVRDTDKLKKFGVVVFDGSADEHWATYDTGSGKKRLFSNSVSAKSNVNNSTIPNILCSHYKPVTPTNTFYDVQGITISTGESPILYIYDETFNTGNISAWRAHLASNPMTVVYELAEPIETELPQSDIDAIKNLHTYKPNTVVMNDAYAEMDVKYVSDTKIYIDNKFRELATVIVNQ